MRDKMNTLQKKLYDDLMNLCSKDDSSFYYVDQTLEDESGFYRIFLYRLASYTEFLHPSALESRGTMFKVDGEHIELVCLPFKKFFNNLENPMVMDLDFTMVEYVQDKMDGSLISNYPTENGFALKSKGSLKSEQAIDAMEWLNDNANNSRSSNLWNFLNWMTDAGITVNMEWTAPHNRIVLPYEKKCLTVLGARDMDTLDDVSFDWLREEMQEWSCEEFLCETTDYGENAQKFIDRIPSMQNIEGYVITLKTGKKVKVKTDWYVSLHRSKDSVNSAKALFECVVNEAHDDLRGLFPDDKWLNDRINLMESKVRQIYNDVVHRVETFYKENKELDRKEYAILGQQKLPRLYFSLAMSLYTGKEVNYQEWMLKHWKDFGITDEELVID
jgi:T4 RnlA family RNA ligase